MNITFLDRQRDQEFVLGVQIDGTPMNLRPESTLYQLVAAVKDIAGDNWRFSYSSASSQITFWVVDQDLQDRISVLCTLHGFNARLKLFEEQVRERHTS